MREVVFLSSAEADLQERYGWLEERQPGLGTDFDAQVNEAMQMLSRQPSMASRYRRTPYRCYRLLRWNFGLFYAIEGSRVMVVAAQDLRQDTETILRKLGLA